jgi:hypothetical protein
MKVMVRTTTSLITTHGSKLRVGKVAGVFEDSCDTWCGTFVASIRSKEARRRG